jgi:hypothetical protein
MSFLPERRETTLIAPIARDPCENCGLAARRLRGHAVLRESAAGALYLDEAAWETLRARRKLVASLVVGTAFIVIALVLYLRRW